MLETLPQGPNTTLSHFCLPQGRQTSEFAHVWGRDSVLACSQDTRPASAYLLLHRSKKLGGAAHVCAHVCVRVCKRPFTPYWEWGTLCPQLLVKLVISPSRRLRRKARLWPALPLHYFQILRGICNK